MFISRTIICFALLAPGIAAAEESREVLDAALSKIEEFGGPISTIVLPPDLSPKSRQAASQLRAIVEQSNLAPAVDEQLPHTYFRLGHIEIKGNVATVSGDIGAVLRPDPKNMFGCGVGYTVSLRQNSQGEWVPNDVSSLTC